MSRRKNSSSATGNAAVDTLAILEERSAQAQSNISSQQELLLEMTGSPATQAELLHDLSKELTTNAKKSKGLTSNQLREKADASLLYKEQLGLFSSLPTKPGDEYPTILGRLPIFLPMQREQQKKFLDSDNAFAFNTPFGSGRRFGANLSVKDEDVLYALLKLRQRKLTGLPSNLPITEKNIYGHNSDGTVSVYAALCTITDVHRELGITGGGSNYVETLDSIKRLCSCTIELELNKHDRYLGPLKKGTSFDLVKVVWDTFSEFQILYVQFNPLVVRWLESDYTFVNWEQRRRLRSDTEKVLHKFFSTQPKNYSRDLLEIADTVGLRLPKKKVRNTIETALKGLMAINFIEAYEITGTGRTVPHRLEVWRK